MRPPLGDRYALAQAQDALLQESVLKRALDLGAQGISVFPCRSTPDWKPTHKSPACAQGFHAATTDPARIRELFGINLPLLIGAPTGPINGFDVLDLDPRHGSDAWEAANPLPVTKIVVTQSGGKHVYFRSHPDMRNSQSKVGKGVDVRGSGGYVILWEEHGGESYLDEPIAEWPAAWQALALAPKPRTKQESRIVKAMAAPSTGNALRILADIVALIEACPEGERHSTIRDHCMTLASLVNADLLDQDDARAAVLAAAEVCGAENLTNVENLFDSAIEKAEPAEIHDGSELSALPPETPEEILAARGGRPLMVDRIRRPSHIGNEPARPYIIKKLMRPGDVCAIIGQPGGGKSALAPLIGYKIAQGKDVFGMKSNAGLVLYMTAEDHDGMGQRIKALEREHGPTDNLGLVDISNLREGDEVADLMATVRELKPAVVFIDTLGAAWAGISENSPEDMGTVVALARGIAATGTCCMLIHHTTKNNDGTPRGHSALNGTLDMLLLLGDKTDDNIVRCKVMKNRAGPADLDIAFRLSSVTLGHDIDGDTITAPLAVELPARPFADRKPVKPLPASLDAPLRVLTALIAASGVESVGFDTWRKACISDGDMGVGEAFRDRWRRAHPALVKAGIVRVAGENVRLIRASEPSLSDLADDAPRH